MKMRDVFELPVKVEPGGVMPFVNESGGALLFVADTDTDEAAAHAINCHDGLVDVLQDALALIKANAIDNPDCTFSHNLAMRACDVLTRAKGES